MSMRAIGYVRVSTTEQTVGGVSLDMQRAKITAYSALEEMELVGILADEGISGSSIHIRPGIQKVLELVRTKQIDAVIIYKLDRVCRNTIESLEIAKLMDRKGIGLHSIMEKLDTKSALGRFFFTLMASLAEMERGIVSERTTAAMERKREKCEPFNANPSYGYRIENGRVIPDLQEQAIISRIRLLHAGGHTIWGIREILTTEGMLNRCGKPFGKTQIHNILQRKAA
jgi:site-specific DNA recombinase